MNTSIFFAVASLLTAAMLWRTELMQVRFLMLVMLMFLVFEGTVQAQLLPPPRHINPHLPIGPQRNVAAQARLRLAVPSVLPATATENVISALCGPDAQSYGAVCGYVNVPLDRTHQIQGQIPIYFELYMHSEPGPAQSAILLNSGGPSGGTTPGRDLWLSLVGPNLDKHDLLLIDDRAVSP